MSSRAVKTGGPRIAVSGTEFRVSSRRNNVNSDGNAGGTNVNRGVDGVGVMVSKCVMASRFGAGSGEGKVGGIGLGLQEHVGGLDMEFMVRVGKTVAE